VTHESLDGLLNQTKTVVKKQQARHMKEQVYEMPKKNIGRHKSIHKPEPSEKA
jgi:hypothetical protein